MTESAQGATATETGSAAQGVRGALILLGALLVVAAVVAALVPIRRVDSITEVSGTPTRAASPATGTAGLRLQTERRTKTTRPLPNGLILAGFTGGLVVVVLGLVLTDVEEVTFAGTKIKLARAVATAAVQQAQAEGLVEGETVPLSVVQHIAQQSAVATVQAEEMLDHRSSSKRGRRAKVIGVSLGYVPPNLLRQLAEDAVEAASQQTPNASPTAASSSSASSPPDR